MNESRTESLSLKGSLFERNDRGFLKDGVKTYRMALMSPLNSSISFLSSHLKSMVFIADLSMCLLHWFLLLRLVASDEGPRQSNGLVPPAVHHHASQMVWFRRLYIMFSRYLFLNTYDVVSEATPSSKAIARKHLPPRPLPPSSIATSSARESNADSPFSSSAGPRSPPSSPSVRGSNRSPRVGKRRQRASSSSTSSSSSTHASMSGDDVTSVTAVSDSSKSALRRRPLPPVPVETVTWFRKIS